MNVSVIIPALDAAGAARSAAGRAIEAYHPDTRGAGSRFARPGTLAGTPDSESL